MNDWPLYAAVAVAACMVLIAVMIATAPAGEQGKSGFREGWSGDVHRDGDDVTEGSRHAE